MTSEGSLNPSDKGDIKITDAVLASICSLGVFEKHNIDGKEYTSFLKFDVFPYRNFEFDLGENLQSKKLCIANYSKLYDKEIYSVFDEIENKLIQEYFDRVLEKVKKCDDLKEGDNFVLINGNFIKSETNIYDVHSRLENGNKHSEMFEKGDSTIDYMNELLSKIKNQS